MSQTQNYNAKVVFTHELYLEVKAFQSKFKLFAKQLNVQNFVHFPLLKTRAVTQALSDKYSSELMALKEEFIRRFADFKDSSICSAHLLPVTLKQLLKNCRCN